MMPSVGHSFIPLPKMSYMWENTKKVNKMGEIRKGGVVKKEERETYQCLIHIPCFIYV